MRTTKRATWCGCETKRGRMQRAPTAGQVPAAARPGAARRDTSLDQGLTALAGDAAGGASRSADRACRTGADGTCGRESSPARNCRQRQLPTYVGHAVERCGALRPADISLISHRSLPVVHCLCHRPERSTTIQKRTDTLNPVDKSFHISPGTCALPRRATGASTTLFAALIPDGSR
ncbi:hypothetical protein BH24CHL4_BH24CHL4_26500 [soil metagenome]